MRIALTKSSVTVLAMILICVGILAQEKTTPAARLAFHLRAVLEPADPNPMEQTPEDRLKTLRKRTAEAISLLDKADFRNFFNDFIDPFWLARAAAGNKISVEELVNKRIIGDTQQTARIAERFKVVLKKSLESEPQWLLSGRAASFMTEHSSHTAEFWIYFDGKWRISPET